MPKGHSTSELAPLAEDSTSSSAPSSASGERPGEHWSVPAFFALGVGSLWAWNAFITPTSFYALLFEGTRWEDTFLPTLTSSFTLVGLVSILALQPLLHLVTARRRVLVSLGAIGVAFGGACLLALWPLLHGSGSAPSPAASAALLLSSAAGASVSQAVLTASLAGYATAFAPQQMALLGWEAALFLCFGVTLFVFPTLTSAIRASEAAPSSLLLFAAGRLLFAPLFVAFRRSEAARAHSDALPALALHLFALSNGWLTTAIFVRAPRAVEERDRPAAGALLVLALNSGLTAGSLLSLGAWTT
ncbi:hypothetical protein EMIHUDRAFT_228675 [Emiliania huxleyi CCMP1516]|uniref:Uncharacterized protein n=2 Tax=Emiliania huxleyi TaxID=2903 RepID=A0A0D3KFE7_EMIH1|nr:hypothetical protein EMIHUDRAFT_228675 [Emiliania huxleyi CCMP1516]EOD34482.1 hypothetical protein EMIHUDRAFT_228675 [Emiliania huxleyi CCMP1516]|eukprot:XP_005786911.1 hypothetical protein EMIHUDRAFT_228675 [Emiliania huxleyi CCMP1516]